MIKKTACALAALSVLSVGVANASSVDPTIVAANRSLSVYLGAVNQNYKEYLANSVADQEKGTIPRIGVEYSLMGRQTPFLFYLSGDYASGDTKYVGALQNGTPWDGSTGNEILNLTTGVGYAFGFGPLALTPGVEYGYSSWKRNLNQGYVPYGYTEYYSHGHAAFTLTAQLALGSRTVLTLGGAYGKTMGPTMNTGGYRFTLGSKPWSRANLGIDFAASRHTHVGAKLSYTEFKYGASPTVYILGIPYAFEPDSTTKHATFDFVVSYNF